MIIKGDKIKLVQKIGNFDKVGDVFEVTGVDDGIVSFSCGYGTGCMTYEEFENYFKKIEPVKKRHWSEWTSNNDGLIINDMYGNKRLLEYQVRNNGKKVQVKYETLKASATCRNDDTFDFSKGVYLAKKRLIVKFLNSQVKEIAERM